MRHLFNFLVFYISSIFFFRILNERFSDWRFSLIGTAFFIFSPRIFANSFYNNKDIIFMSLMVIALYYTLKFIKKINYQNVFMLSIFASLCTSARIMGVSIIFIIIFFFIVSIISKPKQNLKNIKFYLLLIISFYSFLILFWPYLWSNPINNFIFAFKEFSTYEHVPYLLYISEFIKANSLPWHYSINWILITTPILYLLFFIFGYFYILNSLIKKFINLNATNTNYDFWDNDNEKFDLILFFLITFSIFLVIKLESTLYNGWRQLYFLHPLIVYISIMACRYLFLIFKKRFNYRIFFSIICIYVVFICFQIFKMHPYQNVYFNFLAGKNVHLKYPVDYWGLSNVNFLNKILLYDNTVKYLASGVGEKKINISVASHTPLFRSINLLEKNKRDKFNIVGQEYKNSYYIFTNFMSEVNKNIDKKYEIPNNFQLLDEFYVAGIKVYQVYKKLDD